LYICPVLDLVGIADLLMAAAAERHGLTVLHYGNGFDGVTDHRSADRVGRPEW
jgi:predicted nucleic acid-binding protein